MKHLVQFSTGAGSAEVAWRVVAEHGAADTVLLTADTLAEDEDNWRFAKDVVERARLRMGPAGRRPHANAGRPGRQGGPQQPDGGLLPHPQAGTALDTT